MWRVRALAGRRLSARAGPGWPRPRLSLILAALGAAQPNIPVGAFVILAVASWVALFMQRVGLATVPAYLIAGAIVGPEALGLVGSRESLADVSRLASVLLLFGIGMELDLSIMRK